METTVKGEEVKQLFIEGQDYSIAELMDIALQLKKEKELPDGGDVIIFHDKAYKVKRATYSVIRETMMNPIFSRNNALMASLFDDKWYNRIPWVIRYVERKNYERSIKDWRKLVALTFDGDLKEMELDSLTPLEVARLRRIFFRWQADQEAGDPATQK